MKTYMGIPGDVPMVFVTEIAPTGASTVPLDGGPFSWGKGVGVINGARLAMAILKDHLGSEDEAHRRHRRFMWRTIVGWNGSAGWKITGAEIDAVLAEIAATEPLAAQEAVSASRMVAPVENEGGIGVGGGRISPIINKG